MIVDDKWYSRIMGALEADIANQIEKLQSNQRDIRRNKKNYYNWELTINCIDLIIDRLYKQQKVARILES